MADDLLRTSHVILTRFLGAESSRAGVRAPGMCYQITEGATYVELTPAEALAVAYHVLADLDAPPYPADVSRIAMLAPSHVGICPKHGAIDLDLDDDACRLALDPRVRYGPRRRCATCQALKAAARAAAAKRPM